jgi:hypothetical protein
METFVETPAAYILCIVGIPGTAMISLRGQIGRAANIPTSNP